MTPAPSTQEASSHLTMEECLHMFWMHESEPDTERYTFQVPPMPDVQQEMHMVGQIRSHFECAFTDIRVTM